MTQKELLSSVKAVQLLACIGVLLILVGCNRIKEVEVQVIDVESMAGIANINVFYNDKQYVTDNYGKVTIEGKNMKGTVVSINRDIRGYTTPGFYQNCTFQQVYPIESEVLIIGLERFQILKLKFSLPDSLDSKQGCIVLDDLKNCDGQITLYFDLREEGFEFPDNPSVSGNEFTSYMSKSNTPWELSLYFDTYCEFDKSLRNPDQVENISMNTDQDTTYYTVKIP